MQYVRLRLFSLRIKTVNGYPKELFQHSPTNYCHVARVYQKVHEPILLACLNHYRTIECHQTTLLLPALAQRIWNGYKESKSTEIPPSGVHEGDLRCTKWVNYLSDKKTLQRSIKILSIIVVMAERLQGSDYFKGQQLKMLRQCFSVLCGSWYRICFLQKKAVSLSRLQSCQNCTGLRPEQNPKYSISNLTLFTFEICMTRAFWSLVITSIL